ncbi:MAG: ABC transporter permease [Parasporobacterium sp.]|nr:ABC transporter permease [Parasporobacterium sp.]
MRKKLIQYIIGLIVIFAIWHIASIALNKPFFPSPVTTVKAMGSLLIENEMGKHIWASLYRVALGTIFGLLASFPVGLILGTNKKIDSIIGRILDILYPIPKVVFLPIIVVCLGIKDAPKIFLIALVLFFQLSLIIRDAVRHISADYVNSMNALNPTGFQYFIHLVIPACMPEVLSALRGTLGISTALLFITENFASITGLGYFITKSMDARNFDEMYAGILALALLGVILYCLMHLIERKVCRWKFAETMNEEEV